MSARDAFLQRVRQAVQAGNRPGAVTPLEPRGTVGYQGAGPDPVGRFTEACTAAGGRVHVVADGPAAVAKVLELVQALGARKALVGRGPVVDGLGLADRLRAAGLEAVAVDSLAAADCRPSFFGADVGVSGVDALLAETGSIVVQTRPAEPRSLSLLPPVHIAVAGRGQLLADLFDLFATFPSVNGEPGGLLLPSCVVLITGPSKTGDIELRLVTGVHGPGEVHVVLIDRA